MSERITCDMLRLYRSIYPSNRVFHQRLFCYTAHTGLSEPRLSKQYAQGKDAVSFVAGDVLR
jgi:hypothetical protein